MAMGFPALKIVNQLDPRSYLAAEDRILFVPSPDLQSIFYLIFRNCSSGIVLLDSRTYGEILAFGPGLFFE
jgi:hypothetical protein